MIPIEGTGEDMANITLMLGHTTKLQREVKGELQWRVLVYDGASGKQTERFAVGLTEARRLREVLRADVAGRPGPVPFGAGAVAEPGQRPASASVQPLTVNQ